MHIAFANGIASDSLSFFFFFFFQTAHSKVQAHEWQNMFSRLQAKQFQYFYVRAKTQ